MSDLIRLPAHLIEIREDTLLSAFEVLYRRQRLFGKSENTSDNYRINIGHLTRYLGHEARLHDLTDDNLRGAMEMLLDRGRAKATANKLRSHIIALWGFLARKGLVEVWPTVAPIPVPEQLPSAWSREELPILFRAISEQDGEICGLPWNEWLLLQHQFFWWSAERLRAQLMLKPADFNAVTGWIRVRAETRKGARRPRTYRMHPSTAARLKRFIDIDPNRELIFPLDCILETLFNRYRAILKAAGLSHERRDMFHKMRRTSLSYFAAAGGDATRLADHSNSRLTAQCYLDPTVFTETQASDLLFLPWE